MSSRFCGTQGWDGRLGEEKNVYVCYSVVFGVITEEYSAVNTTVSVTPLIWQHIQIANFGSIVYNTEKEFCALNTVHSRI